MDRGLVLVVVALAAVMRGLEAADAMKFLAAGFMKVLEECKKELGMDDHIITDLYHYWKLDYSMLERQTGCAIICMSKKLELLDASGKLHHGNAKEFAVKNGAGDNLANKMIASIQECEAKSAGISDDCSRILEVAKCFRSAIHQLEWDPNLDVILTEVITEI